jgi:hypothetical protein
MMVLQQYAHQQSNSQQQGQQPTAPPPMSYLLGRASGGTNYSQGNVELLPLSFNVSIALAGPIMYAQPAAMAHQTHAPKQPGPHFNQNTSGASLGGNEEYYGRAVSSSNKDNPYLYSTPNQTQHMSSQPVGQQQNLNKQHHHHHHQQQQQQHHQTRTGESLQ